MAEAPLHRAPRVVTLPPGVAFLPAVAAALSSGGLVDGFRHDGDPLALAAATIYVPTRRAARELRSAFLDRLGSPSILLPRIRALGEFSDDIGFFGDASSDQLMLAPPVGPVERMIVLAGFIRAWQQGLDTETAALFPEDEPVALPASAGDALRLAQALGTLMDQVENEEASWADLAGVVPDELAQWWQLTLRFLRIVTEHWPRWLEGAGCLDPVDHRNRLIALETRRLASAPPDGPVVVAGSTGSVPATARLIATIARLPRGAVVLPGLDRHMDQASFSLLGADRPDPPIFGHPQFGLAKLLRSIGVERDEVAELDPAPAPLAARNRLVSDALLPAETTDAWSEAGKALPASALDGIDIIEAPGERAEAVAIAVAMRTAIQTPGMTTALVTPDRGLARRVASELRRFGIETDDSGGTPLDATEPGTLLRLAVDCTLAPGNPAALLSLLKHPLTRCGMPRAGMRQAAETIERVALRGGIGSADAVALPELYRSRLEDAADPGRRSPEWLHRIDPARIIAGQSAADAVAQALAPLCALRGAGNAMPIAAFAEATVRTLEFLVRDADGDIGPLYAGPAGEAFRSLFESVLASREDFVIDPEEWPGALGALTSTVAVKPDPGGHPRVSIWGTLEARLQSVEVLVIGGLNEGVWPGAPANDPFLSRPMKSALRLEPPERRLGQAAHDFQMALGQPRLILSRSVRSDGAPTVPSRWLQRLTTLAGAELTKVLHWRGQTWLHWGASLDSRPDVPFAPRPCPRPPLTARPRHFSVTEIETLRRDPYEIYARHVLGLSPLDPYIRDPGASDRGLLLHSILERFIAASNDPTGPDSAERLRAIGREAFAEAQLPRSVEAVWWPRFEAMVPNYIEWELNRNDIRSRHAEAMARATPIGDTGVTLSGRADRIDLTAYGAEIIDFKSGSGPSRKQAHLLIQPQLALEGALLQRGAFKGFDAVTPSDLIHVRLKPRGTVEGESILSIKGSTLTAAALSERAWAKLEHLVGLYNDVGRGYLSRAMPFQAYRGETRYDHLARTLEWSAGGDDGDDGSEGEP